MKIGILNYNACNLASIYHSIYRIGYDPIIINEKKELKKIDKIIIPGVGAAKSCMDYLRKKELFNEINNFLDFKKPILGICLGMQILTKSSEEGKSPGFGWIPAKTLKFPQDKILKVPHMGWNTTKIMYQNSITNNINENARYYFVHSYYVKVDQQKFSLMKTNYGIDFDSAILKDNIFGVQFHPEKSHKFGIEILKNFSKL